MTTGLSFDDLIPKAGGGGKAPPAPLSFDDLIPQKDTPPEGKPPSALMVPFAHEDVNSPEYRARAQSDLAQESQQQKAKQEQENKGLVGSIIDAVKSYPERLTQGYQNIGEAIQQPWRDNPILAQTPEQQAEIEALPTPELRGAATAASIGGKALENLMLTGQELPAAFGAEASRLTGIGNPESLRRDIRAGAQVLPMEAGTPRGVVTPRDIAPEPPPVSAEAAAKPVMEAGTVDEAIAAAKEASGIAPSSRVVDFSDLIPAQEAAETRPAESVVTQESVSAIDAAPSTLPKEAAPEPPQAISFDDLVDQGPVTLREAEPQPGEPIPAASTAEAPLTAEGRAEGLAEPLPVDQGLFRAYNNLAARHETYSRWVNELTAQRDNDPRINAAQAEIDTILAKVKGNDQYLTKKAASRIEELRGYINDFRSVDTPDMVRVKNALAENYNAMLAMGPEVKAARQAVSNQASKIYGDKASVIDTDELWQAGVKDGDAPAVADRKISEFRSSFGADKLASEHGVEIASDARQLPPHEYAELRRHGYEPINVAGPRIEELAGIPKAAEKPNSVTEVAPTGEGLGRASAEPRELPLADHPEELTAKAPEALNPEQARAPEPTAANGTVSPPPKTVRSTLRPIKGTGEEKPLGLAESVEAAAAKNGLAESFGDQVPTYRVGEHAPRLAAARAFIDRDPAAAEAVAMGYKQPPRDMLATDVFVALANKAMKDGNYELSLKLGTQSGRLSEAKTAGQSIGILRELDRASPVSAIQAIQDARAEALKARKIEPEKATTDTVRVMRKEVRKTASRQSWNDFIVSITCGNQ